MTEKQSSEDTIASIKTENEKSSNGAEDVLPPVSLELREEEGCLVVDYESSTEKGFTALPMVFILIGVFTSLIWLVDNFSFIIPATWLGIGFGLAKLFTPFNEFYRVDRSTGDIQQCTTYGKREWSKSVGNLQDAVFFGFDGQLQTRRNVSYWLYQITLFFQDGKTIPLTDWEQKPNETLRPHVGPLEKALKVPYRELQLEGERKARPGPITMDTGFEYHEGKAARGMAIQRFTSRLMKTAGVALVVTLLLVQWLGE